MLDLNQIRHDTPSLDERIFLNSAGSSLMPKPVLDTMLEYLNDEARFGGYEVMGRHSHLLELFYTEAANLINAESDSIAFTTSATDAFARALSSLTYSSEDNILITTVDYVSNYLFIVALKERYGVGVHIIENESNGLLDLNDLEKKLDQLNPKIVSITHMPTNSGLIQNVIRIGEIISKYPETIYILDACQSLGQVEVDVEKIKCDFLTTSGRKFMRGPRGSGFLYVSNKMIEKGLHPLSSDAFGSDWTSPLTYAPKTSASRYEYFEKSYAGLVGLGQACSYINKVGIRNIEDRGKILSSRLRSNLKGIKGITLYDHGDQLSNIITFTKSNLGKEESLSYLQNNKIVCGASERFSALIDFDLKGISWALRLSPHYFNTEKEIDKVSELIEMM